MIINYIAKNPKHTAYGLLLDGICVVDVDTDDAQVYLDRDFIFRKVPSSPLAS